MSCDNIYKNVDIKNASLKTLSNLYLYDKLINNNEYSIFNIDDKTNNDPFTDNFKNLYSNIYNTDLNAEDLMTNGKKNLININPSNNYIYQNCAIQANNPFFTTTKDYKKCEIINNINLDKHKILKLNADKSKLSLDLKSKDSSKIGFSPYFSNINKAYCENSWYDWIITPNYYLGNTYFKDISKYTELDVYRCYKPCSGDFIPYTTEKREFKCIPKNLFGNGIFDNKYMFSPITLINLIGNLASDIYYKNNINNNLLFILYRLILKYNQNENIDNNIYTINNFINGKLNLLMDNETNNYNFVDNNINNIGDLYLKLDECINNNILNSFSTSANQNYIYSNEFTYKDPRFNEDEPEMYTLNGLNTTNILTPPILIHTWILANIFKPMDEEILNKIISNNEYDDGNAFLITNTDRNNDFTNNIFNGLKKFYNFKNDIKNDTDDKIIRLKNIFYKAVNICYDNKTNFSVNIIAKTKIALENILLQNFIISNNFYKNYVNFNTNLLNSAAVDEFKEYKFYKDYEVHDLMKKIIKIDSSEFKSASGNNRFNHVKNNMYINDNDNKDYSYNYFYSVERLESPTCEKGKVYNSEIGECEVELPKKKEINNEDNQDNFDDDLNIPNLSLIFVIFIRIIFVIIILYVIYIFYDIFGETIFSTMNWIWMNIYNINIKRRILFTSIFADNDYEYEVNSLKKKYEFANYEFDNLQSKQTKIKEYKNLNN